LTLALASCGRPSLNIDEYGAKMLRRKLRISWRGGGDEARGESEANVNQPSRRYSNSRGGSSAGMKWGSWHFPRQSGGECETSIPYHQRYAADWRASSLV